MNVAKTMTFYRQAPFELKAAYSDDSKLLPGTSKELGSFTVSMPPAVLPQKVKVKAKITLNGTFAVENAAIVEEEEFEETVKEKRELPPAEVPAETPEPAEGEASAEAKTEEKKY